MKLLIAFFICWACFAYGKHLGGWRECRRQFTTVDTAPAVWEHCDRRYAILRGRP